MYVGRALFISSASHHDLTITTLTFIQASMTSIQSSLLLFSVNWSIESAKGSYPATQRVVLNWRSPNSTHSSSVSAVPILVTPVRPSENAEGWGGAWWFEVDPGRVSSGDQPQGDPREDNLPRSLPNHACSSGCSHPPSDAQPQGDHREEVRPNGLPRLHHCCCAVLECLLSGRPNQYRSC